MCKQHGTPFGKSVSTKLFERISSWKFCSAVETQRQQNDQYWLPLNVKLKRCMKDWPKCRRQVLSGLLYAYGRMFSGWCIPEEVAGISRCRLDQRLLIWVWVSLGLGVGEPTAKQTRKFPSYPKTHTIVLTVISGILCATGRGQPFLFANGTFIVHVTWAGALQVANTALPSLPRIS